MKLVQKLHIFCRKSILSSPERLTYHCFCSSSSSSTRYSKPDPTSSSCIGSSLTANEQKLIDDLMSGLSSPDGFKAATKLLTTTLLANANISELSLYNFTRFLTTQPDLTETMYFLNSLKHTPKTSYAQRFVLPISKELVSKFFEKGQPQKAFKIFQWVSRPDLCEIGDLGILDFAGFYAVLVHGFCKRFMVLDAMKVVKVMLEKNLTIEDEIRVLVYRGLLREARIQEAMQLKEAFDSFQIGGKDYESMSKFLDNMIANWGE